VAFAIFDSAYSHNAWYNVNLLPSTIRAAGSVLRPLSAAYQVSVYATA